MRGARGLVVGAAVGVALSGAPLRAQAPLAPGWHVTLAGAPAIPLGRLRDLGETGVLLKAGAWYLPRSTRGIGFSADLLAARFARDTEGPLTNAYDVAALTLNVSTKGRAQLGAGWLRGYVIAGVGGYRHGAPAGGLAADVHAGVNAGIGALVPVAGRAGFVEARFHHLFAGQTLGAGRGITFAPLVLGWRF
jgi:hypothetical protein